MSSRVTPFIYLRGDVPLEDVLEVRRERVVHV
jgi:hypothetical protein